MADVYLAVKYHGDHSNRELVKQFRVALANEGVSTYCAAADLEVLGGAFTPAELMSHTFERISSSSAVLVEFSKKGVGLGIEAGYAAAHGSLSLSCSEMGPISARRWPESHGGVAVSRLAWIDRIGSPPDPPRQPSQMSTAFRCTLRAGSV